MGVVRYNVRIVEYTNIQNFNYPCIVFLIMNSLLHVTQIPAAQSRIATIYPGNAVSVNRLVSSGRNQPMNVEQMNNPVCQPTLWLREVIRQAGNHES